MEDLGYTDEKDAPIRISVRSTVPNMRGLPQTLQE